MLTVGLTGGIASGKSLVTSLMMDQGAAVIDADRVYHELLSTDTDLLMAIRSTFSDSFFDENGTLDRKALAAHVFNTEGELQRLNQITHPVILDEVQARVDRILEKNPALPLVFLAIPLLYETRLESMVDKTVLVYAPERTQVERLMSRDALSGEDAYKRVRSQMPIDKKKERADVIIDNSGSVEETAERVRIVLDKLMLESLKPKG